MLIRYVRNKRREKIGVLVALGRNNVGWSRCNKTDRFNKDRGLHIAIMRAQMYNTMELASRVCPSMQLDYIKMVNRANRYFK